MGGMNDNMNRPPMPENNAQPVGNEPVQGPPAGVEPAASTPKNPEEHREVQKSLAGTTWVGLIVGVLLLILLLVFILQNQESVELQLLGWTMTFPIGVGMLIAAIVGALIMALVGGVRIIQLRKQVTR
ncbi:LapA family protein [Corynebacterium macclintockiae]|nr:MULTISPECIES: lipopolysaccharide assembly protein LapA domain-containing protein [Corynebacterium]MDK8869277.1 lipopolysaccharide assembly protein LapA domain-containing protein [Corynebacterium macclintockiae]OFM59741.1 hypothetical protein HMPREF2678_06900 [Corynebacterium sp. HMSC058E07]